MKTADTENGFWWLVVLALVFAIIVLTEDDAHAAQATPTVKALSQAMACQQEARNYLASRWKIQIPLVPVDIVDKLQGTHIAEFDEGRIAMYARTAPMCNVMVHELVHWAQWHTNGTCQSGPLFDFCYKDREAHAYAIEHIYELEQRSN